MFVEIYSVANCPNLNLPYGTVSYKTNWSKHRREATYKCKDGFFPLCWFTSERLPIREMGWTAGSMPWWISVMNLWHFAVGHIYLPAATKLGQGNVFTGVCDSVHRGGLPQCMLGYHTPQTRHPPGPGTPPRPGTPRISHTTPPPKTRHPLGPDPPGADTS